jgi:hypothetical protein
VHSFNHYALPVPNLENQTSGRSLKRKNIYIHIKWSECRALVAHTCNPSYLGGRDQEDCGSKPIGK